MSKIKSKAVVELTPMELCYIHDALRYYQDYLSKANFDKADAGKMEGTKDAISHALGKIKTAFLSTGSPKDLLG